MYTHNQPHPPHHPHQPHHSHHTSACSIGYRCKLLREGRCHFGHTEQHHLYAKTLKQLPKLLWQKLILGTLQKLENQRYKLIPLNQEIINQFPGLSFILINSQGKTLSEDHYYEAIYQDEQNENGEFIVSLLEGDPYWGKIGQINDDIEALYYGKNPIYKDEDKFIAGDFKVGIIKEKYNGQVVLKCSSTQTKYIFTNEKHQNRAFVGSTVRFLAENFERRKRQPRGLQVAQVVSVLKCPVAKDYIYGILEMSPDPNKQIDMQHLYCPLPENINWGLLDEILYEPNKQKYLTVSFTEALINPQDFQQKCSKILNIDPQDPRLLYLSQKIIFHDGESQEGIKVQNLWGSLCQLLSQRRNFQNLQTCYFKPFDKNLPIFQCMYIQDELKKNPEIWRSYIIAGYVTWPCSSKYPWVVRESSGGIIGDPQADIRVILERHKVQTDKFSWKVQRNEQDIIKAWENEMKKNLKSMENTEEKVFTIDGESTRYRDDGFSVKKLAVGEYYEVGIHIADVTRIVKERSEIYKEAEYRFHSCYIGRNFYKPMLPYNLQKYLSLQKDQWRYAFSMYILINKEGVMNLEGVKFKHAMIKPTANLTYKQVDQMLSSDNNDNEIKEAVTIMKELGGKLSERRKRLGCKLEISEEDEEGFEKNSQAQMMVEEFMLLANEIVTDYIKNQGEELEKRLVKIKNEEKNMVREENKKKSEEEIRMKEEKKREKEERRIAKVEVKREIKEENKTRDEEKRKLKEEKKALRALKAHEKKEKVPKKVKVKKIVEKKVKKEIVLDDGRLEEVEEHIKEEIEEEIKHHLEKSEDEHEEDEEIEEEIERRSSEEIEYYEEDEPQKILDKESEISEFSEKEDVSEDEEIIEAVRKGSIEQYEEEEDIDSLLLNISKIEEFDAISACAFLEQVWREIDKGKKLDLRDQRKFSESVKSVMDDKSIKNSIKKYLRYLLRLNDRKVRLFIHKKLRGNNQQPRKEEHYNVAINNHKPQDAEIITQSELKHEVIIESQVKGKEESVDSAVVQQEKIAEKEPIVAPQEIKEKELSKRKQAKLERKPQILQSQGQIPSQPLVESRGERGEKEQQETVVSQEDKTEELNRKDEPQSSEKLIFDPDDECMIDAKGIMMPTPKIETTVLNIQGNKASYAAYREKRIAERKQRRKERQLQKNLQKDSRILAKPVTESVNIVVKSSQDKDQENEAKNLHQKEEKVQSLNNEKSASEPENKDISTTEGRVEPRKEEEKLETQKKIVVEIIDQHHSQQGRQSKNVKQGRRKNYEPIIEYIIKPSPTPQQKGKEQKLEGKINKENQGNNPPRKQQNQPLSRKEKREKEKMNEYNLIYVVKPQQKEESEIEKQRLEIKTQQVIKNEGIVILEANPPSEKIIADNPTNINPFNQPVSQEKQIKREKPKRSRREKKAQKEVKNYIEPPKTNTVQVHKDTCQPNIEENPISESKKEESKDQQEKQRSKKFKNNRNTSNQAKNEKKMMKRLQRELAKRGMSFGTETPETNKISHSDQDILKREDEIITPCEEAPIENTQESESLHPEQERLSGNIQRGIFEGNVLNQEKTAEKYQIGEPQEQEKLLEIEKKEESAHGQVTEILQNEEIIKEILGMNCIRNDINIEEQAVQELEKTSKEEENEQYETSNANTVPTNQRNEILEMNTNNPSIILENHGDERNTEDFSGRQIEKHQETEEPQDSHEAELNASSEPPKEITTIEFDLPYSENIIKKYNKLKDSHKMKFTSPIRRFHDILVHELIDKILDLEGKFSEINNEIQKKLDKQENKNEKATKKKAKKSKKIKTRYQIFQEIYSTMKDKIKQLEKSQERIKLYYQENHDIKEGGMDRAEREKEIMEKCKLIIAEQRSIITGAIVVGFREKVRVFLLDYGLECVLGGNYKVIPGRHAMIKLEKRKTAMIGLYDEIIVRIDVKKNFPLDFEVVYVCGSSKN